MASKTFTEYASGTSNKYGVQIVCTSTADVVANTSTLTVKVNALHPYIDISSRSGKVKIDGTKYSYKQSAIDKAGPTQVFTKTVTLQHANDGTRSVDVVAYFPFDLNSSSYGRITTVTVSGTLELDTIPRASAIEESDASVTVDGVNAWHLTVSKHADAFRHRATLTFGDNTITTDVFDTEASVVIPLEWLNLIPTQTQSTVDVSIQTYSDESCATEVGDPTGTSFVIKVPEDASPELGTGWATVAPCNTGTAAAGMGVYVQGFSRACVTFDASRIALKYGANAVTCQVVYEGNTDPNYTPVLAASGKRTIQCIATDSRGNQASEEIEINVYPYATPTLTGVQMYRCNASGTETDEGTYLWFKATCKFSECGGENSVSIAAAWKNVNSTSFGNSAMLTNGVGSVLGAGTISATSSFNGRITASDRLGNTVTYTGLISTANVAFHLRDGGKGGAFGKYAEKDGLLDVPWMIRADGGFETITLSGKTDLNDIVCPNVYAGASVAEGEYINCPIDATEFSLEVIPAGGGRLMQRFTVHSKTEPVTYERYYSLGAWGAWMNEALRKYPVGSVYISASATSPQELFGGVWAQINDVFPIAAGSAYPAGTTGGEAEHALTKDELPVHNHFAYKYTGVDNDWGILNIKRDNKARTQVATSSSSGKYAVTSTVSGNLDWPYCTRSDVGDRTTDDNIAHNNMPPYKAFYMWERTA